MPNFWASNRKQVIEAVEKGTYLQLPDLFALINDSEPLWNLLSMNFGELTSAPGSSSNHQAWEGGYLDHVREVMNIAVQFYFKFDNLRGFPFVLSDALVVLYLHDLEKPWKHVKDPKVPMKTKADRRQFRDEMIEKFGIKLTEDQKNALRYVEGIPDSEYVPGQRIMGEMAAFCHMCDIASARLWHNKGREEAW